jgi:hypothetical protein
MMKIAFRRLPAAICDEEGSLKVLVFLRGIII